MARKTFYSENGDKCDSQFEVIIIDDLIERGVPYDHHPDPYEYYRKVRGGYCRACDSNEVVKGCLYTPDLAIARPDGSEIVIELKGGDIKQASRGRLTDFCKYHEENFPTPLYFIFRDNRKIKGTKMRHSTFAAKLGCPWHIGNTVPEEWIL